MKRTIAVVLYAGVDEFDLVGPWQVFATLRWLAPESCSVFTVAAASAELRGAHGLRLRADYTFESSPRADILLVPGGPAADAAADDPCLLAYVRQAGARADLTVSVATGVFVLARAGFLRDKPATTAAHALDRLRALGGGVKVAAGPPWVDAGSVITTAGAVAGIDLALHLVQRLWGPELAHRVAASLEYPPGQADPVVERPAAAPSRGTFPGA